MYPLLPEYELTPSYNQTVPVNHQVVAPIWPHEIVPQSISGKKTSIFKIKRPILPIPQAPPKPKYVPTRVLGPSKDDNPKNYSVKNRSRNKSVPSTPSPRVPSTSPSPRVSIFEGERKQRYRKIGPLKKLAKQIANDNQTDFYKVLAYAGQTYYASNGEGKNPRLANLFQKVFEMGEEYDAKCKPKIPKDLSTFIKYGTLLSVSDYEKIRSGLEKYVDFPHDSTIRNYTKTFVPTPHDFLLDGKPIGQMYNLKDVLVHHVTETLEHWFEAKDKAEEVPDKLLLVGGIGGDGFSGEADRMGKDIDLNTSSRYIIGVKHARLMGDPKSNFNSIRSKEFFVETSQSADSMRPLGILAGKENFASMKHVWTQIQEELKDCTQFEIQFDGRTIQITFHARFIGDGKAFLNMTCLNGAYCYLCGLTHDEAQDLNKINEGMPVTRSIPNLHKKYNSLMTVHKRIKSTKSFCDQWPTAKRDNLCGEPIAHENDLLHTLTNLPSQHFLSKVMDFCKDLNTELTSMNRTASGENLSQERKAAKLREQRRTKAAQKEKKENEVPCAMCNKMYKNSTTLLTHVTKKSKQCLSYYKGRRLLERLQDAKKREAVCRKKSAPKKTEDQIEEECKALFTKRIKEVLNIAVNQVKKSGHGASVENFNTTRKFLAPENREKVLSLYYCDDKIKEDIRLFLQQAHVISHVVNRIGKIHVNQFRVYVKTAYLHWAQAFGKFRTMKNSLHWMLGHVADLIGMNNGYSLAEVSENSLEASIKRYRYITQNLSRQTNFQDNSIDCLKVMFILSSWRLRQFVKRDPSQHDLKDDEDSAIIECFFVNGREKWVDQ